MALVLDGERLRLVLRRWSVFGIPLPLALAPRINAYEFAEDGRFHFHVEIAHPSHRPDRRLSRLARSASDRMTGQVRARIGRLLLIVMPVQNRLRTG